ncbi:MAG TPA: chorismate-binding protein, partial [Gemmatimonadales bacterium]|nr:chorismate-binding protein [Gemmatimonadales bacterium]
MTTRGFDEFAAGARSAAAAGHAGARIPVVREFSADTLTPVVACLAVSRPPFAWLLESLVGGERWARYSFIGTEPAQAWRYGGGRVERWTPRGGWEPAGEATDVLAHVGSLVRSRTAVQPPPGLPPFTGGLVGYLGYDVVRTLENLPSPPPDDRGLPDALFMMVDTLVILDNAFSRVFIVANAELPDDLSGAALRRVYDAAMARLDDWSTRLTHPPTVAPLALDRPVTLPVTSRYPREAFERDVTLLREHILAGDAFQVVLSRRQDLPCPADPFAVYRALRVLNPAPYLFYLRLDGLTLAGSSPEVLVRVGGGDVIVRPIAGTRPRAADPDHDAALAAELLADEKELAEHRMLVDLGRNDVGRVAQYGSVRVAESEVIERYSHVQHIVSEVRGRLRPGLDGLDALRAGFPAGTVSGAPKIRAMQLIDGLEPTRRGPYAGAVGYVG